MKNTNKATLYVLLGTIVGLVASIGIVAMWFSGSFLPVIGAYALRNRILRYILYVLLAIVVILSAFMAEQGFSYIRRRRRKTRKGR